MTRYELSRLHALNQEIETEYTRIRQLEAAVHSCTTILSGLPHRGSISDKTALVVQITECKSLMEQKQMLRLAEYNRLIRYIDGIDEPFVRLIFRARYVDGKSWRQVAHAVGGGGTTEDSVRMIHNRFLQKH